PQQVVGSRIAGEVTTADKNDITWLIASIGSSPCLKTRIIRPESNCIVEIQKVIHTVKIDKVRQIVGVESFGKSANVIDKENVSFGEMQLKQEDRSCVHASIELHLHVVPSEHESDQH
ncbi:hypothetical protein Tco_0274563, partial [Tanacetum coccineum]